VSKAYVRTRPGHHRNASYAVPPERRKLWGDPWVFFVVTVPGRSLVCV